MQETPQAASLCMEGWRSSGEGGRDVVFQRANVVCHDGNAAGRFFDFFELCGARGAQAGRFAHGRLEFGQQRSFQADERTFAFVFRAPVFGDVHAVGGVRVNEAVVGAYDYLRPYFLLKRSTRPSA